MAEIPYILQLQKVLTSNGSGTMTHTVPNNESLELNKWVVLSTGGFNVTGIRLTGGNNLTNASENTPIKSGAIANGANGYNGIQHFPLPIVLKGGQTIEIDLKDTSGSANTVDLSFMGKRTV